MLTSYIKPPSNANFFVTSIILLMIFTPALTATVYDKEKIDGFYLSKDMNNHVIYAKAEFQDSKKVILQIEDVYVGKAINGPTTFTHTINIEGMSNEEDLEHEKIIRRNIRTYFESRCEGIRALWLDMGEGYRQECKKAPKWVTKDHLQKDTIMNLAKFLDNKPSEEQTKVGFKEYMDKLDTEENEKSYQSSSIVYQSKEPKTKMVVKEKEVSEDMEVATEQDLTKDMEIESGLFQREAAKQENKESKNQYFSTTSIVLIIIAILLMIGCITIYCFTVYVVKKNEEDGENDEDADGENTDEDINHIV